MSYDSVLKSIQKGAIAPVYMFFGEERLLKGELIQALLTRLGLTDINSLNRDVIHAADTSAATVVEKAETLPFLSDKRVVIVNDIDSNPKMETSDTLLRYLANPSKSTCLVFTAKLVDKRKKFFRLIHDNFSATDVARLRTAQVKGWLSSLISENSARITDEAVTSLLDLTGNDLDRLKTEFEKICLYAEGEEITRTDVLSLVTDNARESVFEMTDAMGRRDLENALYTLNKLLYAGEPPLKIFVLIVRELRIILITKALLEKKIQPKSIPSKAGFAPFLLSKYTKIAALFDTGSLRGMFLKLPETDRRLKSDFPPQLALEKLIIDFCDMKKRVAGS